MSLSRRACYKCGNVGHYAEVCSSSERLCYNCTPTPESTCMLCFCFDHLLIPQQANSQDMSLISALFLVLLRPNSATTVKA